MSPRLRRRRWGRALVGAVAAGAAMLPLSPLAPPAPWTVAARAAPADQFTYATVDDGVKIALAVSFPAGFPGTGRWPALLVMDGYSGGAEPLAPSSFGDHYVIVHASIRGTGCSGGTFDLFSQRSAVDGKEVIDQWIPSQPWSNGAVGITGHSYPGLTGFFVAEQQPTHLKATAVSGLIDDLYRGSAYRGGVGDSGFPALWTALFRPGQELYGNLARYGAETGAGDLTCAANIAGRGAPPVADDPLVKGATTSQDGPWWQLHSLITQVDRIDKPIHVIHQYQDEQTGPRGGPLLWQRVPETVPKRLVLTNGVHATNDVAPAHADRVAWLDCWVIHDGVGCPNGMADPSQRVQAYFETTGPGNQPGQDRTNPPYVSSGFPLPETGWQRLFLHGDGSLAPASPGTQEGGRTMLSLPEGRTAYLSGAGAADATDDPAETVLDGAYGQVYGPAVESGGPDELRYSFSAGTETAVLGPIEADLWLSTTANDVDVFVQLLDQDPQGRLLSLQRGLQRASFRAVDLSRSDLIASGPYAGQMYRPYHPFTSSQAMTPLEAAQLNIEVYPAGFVLRPGHRLIVRLQAPNPMDELDSYVSGQPPAVVTVLSDAAHPSSVLVPFLATMPPVAEPGPACGSYTGVRCTKPLSG